MIGPDERHWHGATPDHTFTHIAIQGANETGRMADWEQLVEKDAYRSAAGDAL